MLLKESEKYRQNAKVQTVRSNDQCS